MQKFYCGMVHTSIRTVDDWLTPLSSLLVYSYELQYKVWFFQQLLHYIGSDDGPQYILVQNLAKTVCAVQLP